MEGQIQHLVHNNNILKIICSLLKFKCNCISYAVSDNPAHTAVFLMPFHVQDSGISQLNTHDSVAGVGGGCGYHPCLHPRRKSCLERLSKLPRVTQLPTGPGR